LLFSNFQPVNRGVKIHSDFNNALVTQNAVVRKICVLYAYTNSP